jgi:hypothetical protein
MEKYKEKLVERLINNYDYNIENKLLNSFNFNSNMDQYVEMKLMIDDIFQSRELDKFIQTNTKINLTSEKYKDMKLSDVKVTSKVLSEDLWKNMKPTYNIMNIDKQLQLYITVYKKTLSVIFSYQKEFDINYNLSIVDFDYTINNKTYQIKSTMSQSAILMKLTNYKDGLTMTELEDYLSCV